MKRLSVKMGALTCVALMSCATLPRPGKPAMPDVQFRMRDFRLANGMRIIVEEDHASPLVGVFTVVGVGSSGDPKGREGLAHLIEHLAFRASPYNRGTAWNQLENAGVGFLNAQTWFDYTMYEEVGTKDLLPTLLTIEAGRLFTPLVGVDQKAFDVEREVVRNELRQRGENAMGPAFSFLQEAAFPPSHHYSRPIGGGHESLNTVTFDDAKKFVAENYKPSNMTMLIIGDVDLDHVHEALVKALPMSVFQPLPPTKEPFPSRMSGAQVEPPEPPAAKLIRRNSTVASPELYVVWSLPRSFDSETVLLDFVESAASRELSGAFFSDPDIVNVQVLTIPGVEASMLVAAVTLRKGDHVDRSYERVLDQLVKLWASGDAGREMGAVTSATGAAMAEEANFMHQRNDAVMKMTLDAENLMARGSARLTAAHFTGDPLVYTRRLHALAEVSPSRVAHFAETYLKRDRARAVLVEPFPPNSKDATPAATGLGSTTADSNTASFSPDAVKKLGNAYLAKAKNETVVRAKRDHIEETLPNGLRVVVHKRENSLPVAVVELVMATGSAGTLPKGAGELGMQMASPRKHTFGRGADFGIGWSQRVGADRSTITGSGASGNVSNMIAQLSERVTSMHVEDGNLAFFKTDVADYLEKTEQLPLVKADRDLRAQLFTGHPFADTALIADQRKLSSSDIEGWFERAWGPSNAVLVVTGDIDAEKVFADVKQYLGGWAASANAFKPVEAPKPRAEAAPTVLVTNQPGASQAQFHLACLADSSQLTQELANETASKLLATELFNKIRGELGASYGFNGGSTSYLGGVSRLDWVGSIENTRLSQALSLISGMFKGFETSVLTDKNLERARWSVARESTLENATTESVAAAISHEVLMGRKPDDIGLLFETLANVGRPQVSAAWKQCQGGLVISIVGDEDVIRAALKTTDFK